MPNFVSKPIIDKMKAFNKYSDYKIDLICLNCRRVQEVVILKGVSVKMAMDAGRECSCCGCNISFDKEGKIPYSW